MTTATRTPRQKYDETRLAALLVLHGRGEIGEIESTELFDRFLMPICWEAIRSMRVRELSQDDAEDIRSAAIMKVLAYSHTVQPDRRVFWWLVQVAKRAALDWLEQQGTRRRALDRYGIELVARGICPAMERLEEN